MLELQNTILEMVAKSEDLASIANRLCVEVQRLVPATICSVLSVDRSGRLHPLAGPNLPQSYSNALDGIVAGPLAGSCGTAAYLGTDVTVTDIELDPRWQDFKALALPLGLKACWSSPILNGKSDVIGTFAFYYRDRRGPSELERRIVATCVYLCAIAIEHDQWRLEHQRRAYVDALTDLPNRGSFNAALAQMSCDQPGAWGILVIDLDNLKVVNDTFGHHAGDCLLMAAAQRIGTVLAPDRAYRLGGDEFAILVQDPATLRDLDDAASKVLDALGAPADCGGHVIIPRATIGGAVIAFGDRVSERVRQNADFALYHAKETGRGGFVRYWPGIGTRITHRLGAIRDLDSALRDARIDAFYQPIVRLDTREIVGLEALCRMKVGNAIVPAAAFHEAMTDAHVATELTEHMLSVVAADIRTWLEMGIPMQHVGINVSSADFQSGKLSDQIMDTFEQAGVPLKHVVLEVTETVYMGRRDHIVERAIEEMRAQGLRIALDDFGTGYASLTHLMTVPVDIIKIDKSFVDQLAQSEASRAIVEGLLHIARTLDIRVVAEGVETENQAGQLSALGCALGQGYLFSPAVDRAATTRLLLTGTQRVPGMSSISRGV
ncbi:MAG: diguanylate cyclase domain protein [Bradyrhizobium sp.]|nr:diguanylate cyclase domain protein [Bradyrhizobium sp.]